MSGLAGDDYNETIEATRGAAAAPVASLDFLSTGLGPGYDRAVPAAMPVLGDLPLKTQVSDGGNKTYSTAMHVGYGDDVDGLEHKLGQPLMSIGQMSTQSQTPTMMPREAGAVKPTAANFSFPVAQRDGKEWRAKDTPGDQATRDRFFFAPTSLAFDSDTLRLHELISRVFEFCEREFAVEIRATNSDEGVFDLACFVKTAMVVVRVTIWKDVEKGCQDKSDTKHYNGLSNTEEIARFVVEMVLVEGCGITFCDVFRRFKRVLDPKGLLQDRDALSTTASVTTAGGAVEHGMLVSEEVAMDGEQLMEFGGEFSFPSADEWESVLADCEVFHDDKSQNDAKCISQAVESLASIACTYAAKDLEYLAECVSDRKIGFCHGCYNDDNVPSTMIDAGDRHAAGKHVLSQLWAMAVLVKHLARHPGNLKHLQAIVPELDGAARKLLADSYANGSAVCAWVTVVHALAEALCSVLVGCRDYDLVLSVNCKAALPNADANVDAFYKQAAGEEKAATRTVAAADNLKKAYACWRELRSA